LLQSIYQTNQESEYLQFCRSETNCQYRIHCLLEAVSYLTFSSTRLPPAIVRPLPVEFELLNASVEIWVSNYSFLCYPLLES